MSLKTNDAQQQVKAALREEFPDWSIIASDKGRWWATRGPNRGEKVQHGASCFEADAVEGLRAQLDEVAR
ncbi:hypothetical protein [Actinomadura rudentiformis]|uniref:Uncharacterized protein n=1 Tax=Actinomadura rudentiformis TaxID=359158 RepID=A0A6H9YQ23_9ACTN|nr:hypothetical protein [Actinomadura rudentiformis]KAB2342157.1 hypothetical protein F8566_39545 [Actinomadura rudentiformis]